MTPLQRAAENIAAEMAKGLSEQEAFNRCVVELVDRALELVELCDKRERKKLRQWGPDDRAIIISNAFARLCATGTEGVPMLAGAARAMQLSEFLTSSEDAYTLARRAINSARISLGNERRRRQDLGEHAERAVDGAADTARDALLERAARVLSDQERSLLRLRLHGYSFRAIEEGTARAGWKVDRREVAQIWRGVEQKLRAEVSAQPESWESQLPRSPLNPSGVIREASKDDGYQGETVWGTDDPAEAADLYQRDTFRLADRRAERPATAEELQEARDAAAAVDARVGKSLARVVLGVLDESRSRGVTLADWERQRQSFAGVLSDSVRKAKPSGEIT